MPQKQKDAFSHPPSRKDPFNQSRRKDFLIFLLIIWERLLSCSLYRTELLSPRLGEKLCTGDSQGSPHLTRGSRDNYLSCWVLNSNLSLSKIALSASHRSSNPSHTTFFFSSVILVLIKKFYSAFIINRWMFMLLLY